ncbi:MAG TPA: glutathione S-transferase, partial [Hyphomonadaceae bacterium]|nr:glutathione S-transferase [Hyphomonadaceae bacterium]
MITVHHLNNSRSQRVLWLLEELELRYEVRRYERDKQTMLAPRELRTIHPLGKSPVITDNGKTMAETGAIVEFILDRYGNGRLVPPVGTDERLRYTYWLHYAEGSAMTPLLLKLVFTRMPMSAPPLLRGIVNNIAQKAQERMSDPQIRMHMDYWDNELAKAEWFAGKDFTAADIMMSFPLEAASIRA